MALTPSGQASLVAAGQSTEPRALSLSSGIAAEVKALVVGGQRDAARERFADLVAHQQRRASRIAYQYLRDAHDADEAVQDAFVKVFTHIATYREDLPFEVWFTRITRERLSRPPHGQSEEVAVVAADADRGGCRDR